MARALMFMGTGSDVGKSLIVAGLSRAFTNRGLRVAPFKPQNMSNNAAVTADGGEIGRAQALQARAARREPLTAMNPVLLKPEHASGAQVVVRGQRIGSMPAREYWSRRGELLPQVLEAYRELAADADLILVEGAGSASEVNLRHNDIANFGFARAANVPVVLIGDIHRGGVIASLVGTFAVIDPEDAKLLCGTLINRFQGDSELFRTGAQFVQERTRVPNLAIIPEFPDAYRLPAEDVLALETDRRPRSGPFRIVVPRLPRIANFDDLDPLRLEPGVTLEIVAPGMPLPLADLIVIPGSKSTLADLAAVRRNGWDIDILAHYRRGGAVLGICGGYQMLGRTVADSNGIEGKPSSAPGLGLLDVSTTLAPKKQLRTAAATHLATGEPVSGYHMHLGITSGVDTQRPFASADDAPEGATSPDGRVMGTYLHGLFAADGFRAAFLARLGTGEIGAASHEAGIDATLDALAEHLERHLDLDQILRLTAEVN